MEIRMQQILSAEWDGAKGRTYSIIALGVDGFVYRYDAACNGWIRFSTGVAECGINGHKH